ncbi:MAG: alpha-L-arabinofuranosidase C-terminal domain-containing protein [Bacteroidales bacterium]|nr:alpha-L-arabinofuranosidase C-terminal domain-containing protein [Bacteroidales bacterium]
MKRLSIFSCLLLIAFAANAQETNKLIVDANQGKVVINKNIYGHFAEHLGRCIYDGIWVGKDSKIPNTDGYRTDIVNALKDMKIPVLRWPGGCFADTYHWQDGIGPLNKRAKMMNYHWGGVVENNTFGTHEFLNLCEMLGCEPYISANVGSGSVVEMTQWIEYMNSDKDVPMANLRRQNGREKPWNVKYLGVGNESWGCGGNMTPDYYVNLLRNYSEMAGIYGQWKLKQIGCGANSDDYNWTDVVMKERPGSISGLSLHYYTIAGSGWGNKSAATGFEKKYYFSGLEKALKMNELVEKHSAIMDKYDPKKQVGLMVDEWGIWTDVEPGTEKGFLFQQNSIRDALIASLTLDIFNNHADRVKMANIAQTINVLQSVILTQGNKMVLTPTYYVFKMYAVHQDAKLLPSQLIAEDYEFDGRKIPALSSSVSEDQNGNIHVSVTNLNPDKEIVLSVELVGKSFEQVKSASVLTAPEYNSYNGFDAPEVVKPVDFKNFKKINSSSLQITVPSKALVVLEMK